MMAAWHLFYAGQGWSQNVERTHEITQHLALKAIKLDPNNAEALGIYGHICSIVNKDFDAALNHFDRSLRLNPSLAFIWALFLLLVTMVYLALGRRGARHA